MESMHIWAGGALRRTPNARMEPPVEELQGKASDRRVHTRFELRPMYSAIRVRLTPDSAEEMEGHAYDISRGGLCFELDDALPPGTPIQMHLTLPEWLMGLADGEDDDAGVRARGTVVWTDDDGARGPVRMAAVFTSFESVGERELFCKTLNDRTPSVAA
jgi:hypothetical protein